MNLQPHLFEVDTAVVSRRVLIRRFREGDGQAFYQLVANNSALISDHFPALAETVTSPAKGESEVRKRLAAWLMQEMYSFGIWRNEEADLIGFISLCDIDWQIPRADLNYFLHHQHTGQGFMTEALAKIITLAFKQLQLEKLVVKTLADNAASQRLVRKLGFRREGDLRNEYRKMSGLLVDITAYGMTAEEFTAY
jgi:RimJ/RimL family protein N-acetyltransferase